MKKNYIGLANSMHDTAISIVDARGNVVFAEATERYLQSKRSINCVPDFIDRTSKLLATYCDPGAELVVAQSWSDQTVDLMTGLMARLKEDESRLRKAFGEIPQFMKTNLSSMEFVYRSIASMMNQTGQTLKYELNQREGTQYVDELPIRKYDHHLTHAAAACYSSPFRDAVCVVLDGLGEGRATACYSYRDGVITALERRDAPGDGSLGFFYNLICVACGFGALTGEEWKVMGLASYGEPKPEICKLLRSLIKVRGLELDYAPALELLSLFEQIHFMRRKDGQPPREAANLAAAGQQVFSEVYFELLGNAYDVGLSKNLIVTGGCALNSSANGKILEQTKFEQLYVFCAPADDGNAIGAALLAFHEDHPKVKPRPALQSPYLGSSMSPQTLERALMYGPPKRQRLATADLCRRTAAALASGRIVGWIQGRAEFGPRALGARSILADPRDPDMKDKINARIKFREEFRPFAPAILHEHGPHYFVNYQEAPYMERTLSFRNEVVTKVPAVVHRDRTGRLQTVKREWNETFYNLIAEFYSLTGVPLLLNTSFNVMGKPIVHSVEDALAVFYTSGLDVLVIDDAFFEK